MKPTETPPFPSLESSNEGVISRLEALNGVGRVEDLEGGLVYLPVTDIEKWNDDFSQLKPLFAELVQSSYGDTTSADEESTLKQLGYSFKNATGVYIQTSGHKIAGYFSVELVDPKYSQMNGGAWAMGDLNVSQEFRGRNYASILVRTAAQHERKQYVIGETVNPIAIAAIEKGAKEAGFRTIFGPSQEELQNSEIAFMHQENMYGIERKGFLSPLTLEPGNDGFYLVDPAYLPPVEPGVLQFLNPEHPVYARMQKLLELQERYKTKDGHVTATVVAHVFCIRDEGVSLRQDPPVLLPKTSNKTA